MLSNKVAIILIRNKSYLISLRIKTKLTTQTEGFMTECFPTLKVDQSKLGCVDNLMGKLFETGHFDFLPDGVVVAFLVLVPHVGPGPLRRLSCNRKNHPPVQTQSQLKRFNIN
jgi:hypothetical protein